MSRQEGFTIVEVTLFLAMTGLLAVLLLGGWTVTLNNQRYRDSVKATQSFVQQQYNLVYNVENGRGANLVCNSEATVVENSGDNNPRRGQTDCVVMGRYLHIQAGRIVQVYAIVGREPDDPTPINQSDAEAIEAYQANVVREGVGLSDERLSIPWQATVVNDEGDSDPLSYAIAIIRAPRSGIVHTYASEPLADADRLPSIDELAIGANERRDTKLCLDAGAPLSGGRMGVVIKAAASSQSSVQPILADEGEDRC